MRGESIGIPAPQDWSMKPLVEATTIISRGTAPNYVEASSVLAVGQRCVQEWGFDASAARPHNPALMRRVLHPRRGDVLLNSTGTGTIGRSCLFDVDCDSFIVDSHVTVIRPRRGFVEGRWIQAVFSSSWGLRYLENNCYTGSTNQVELVSGRLAQTIAPVPPIAEQRRIAEILDTVDEQVRALQRSIGKRNKLRAGVLTENLRAISLMSPPSNWQRVPLGMVVPCVDYGISHPLVEQPCGVPVLRMSNVGEGRAGFGEIKYCSAAVPYDLLLRYGDVLFNRTNSVDHVGRSGMWRDELPEATFASYLVRLNVDSSSLLPEYLALWLSHPVIRQRVRALSTPAVQQVNVNPTTLRSLQIDLPSTLDEQCRITALLDVVDKEIGHEIVELDKLRLLKQGLMEDLLTGKVRTTRSGEFTG